MSFQVFVPCIMPVASRLRFYFVGATLPHGMVKAGMDVDAPDNVRALPEDVTMRTNYPIKIYRPQDTTLIRSIVQSAFPNYTSLALAG
jgi:hypothetical protein